MSNNKTYQLETLALHVGQEKPESDTLSRAVPVYRTTAYVFNNSQHGADLFGLKVPGYIYARLHNPTNDVLNQRIAAMEGGFAAHSLASGTAAIYFTVTNIAATGDELVAANNLYGGTYSQFDAILPESNNIHVRFTPLNDFQAVEQAFTPKTRAVFIETVGNPSLGIADIEEYAKIAHAHHVPLIVDSTFAPTPLIRPIEFGADLVIHSLSKWYGGHGAGIGGIVVDAGKFDWSDKKFTLYNTPARDYHGLVFSEAFGKKAFWYRLLTVGLRNQGATLAPDAAWIFLQGVESLALRIARHSENALKVAKHLQAHPKVAWVRYPSLSEPKLAAKYLPHGAGGMVVFGVKGGAKEAQFVVDNLDKNVFTILANVGDAKSLAIHPGSTTHSQVSEEDQLAQGITPELIRLSIGLEAPEDIINALDEALAKI